jgi:hypothetical protein
MIFNENSYGLDKFEGAASSRCFLCGQTFPFRELTREHVFPKWLLRKFSLWDRQLVLLNQTSIAYRNLTIPACENCNSVVLAKIENEIFRRLNEGPEAIRSLGRERLFIWIAKILFGVLYAEALLPSDRAQPTNGPIVPEHLIREFQFLHSLMRMQVGNKPLEFHSVDSSYHTSILVFSVQQHPLAEHRFMYRDDVNHACVAIRLDTVGLIWVADGGIQERFAKEVMPAVFHHDLHPIQFEQLSALVFTKARCFNRVPKFMTTVTNKRIQMYQFPLAGLSERPLFDDFDQDVYVQILANFTNHPIEMISPGDGTTVSWIGDYANPTIIDIVENPWP